jgi:hypothetical protein
LNKNVAALYRAFSTYDAVPLSYDLPFDYPYTIALGQSPLDLPLKIDATGLSGWTKIDVLNYGDTVLNLTPDQFTGNLLPFLVPITHGGVYAFSALITHADGSTQSTTNLLTLVAVAPVPEPATIVGAAIAVTSLAASIRRRRIEPLNRRHTSD